MKDDLISRKTAKEEILNWAVRINDRANLSTADTMMVLDTLPAVDQIFELVRLYKSIDWEKKCLLFYGY